MSGHRIRRGPFHKPKAWRWGPAGWYCCGNRLMAAGMLPGGTPVHRCLHCGLVITVEGEEILDTQRPASEAATVSATPEQPTFF